MLAIILLNSSTRNMSFAISHPQGGLVTLGTIYSPQSGGIPLHPMSSPPNDPESLSDSGRSATVRPDQTQQSPVNVSSRSDRAECEETDPLDIDINHEQDPNPEDDIYQPVPGWPKIAMLFANTPEFASFSRFRDLNMKSLLYYQAELVRLRKELHNVEWRDYRHGSAQTKLYSERAQYLVGSERRKRPDDRRQWEVVKRIRVVLKDYSE